MDKAQLNAVDVEGRWLDDLAQAIDRNGIAQCETAVARFAEAVAAAGVAEPPLAVLIAILADATQPTVARERAFGRLHGHARSTAIEPWKLAA